MIYIFELCSGHILNKCIMLWIYDTYNYNKMPIGSDKW